MLGNAAETPALLAILCNQKDHLKLFNRKDPSWYAA